jgi:hypothetical protein
VLRLTIAAAVTILAGAAWSGINVDLEGQYDKFRDVTTLRTRGPGDLQLTDGAPGMDLKVTFYASDHGKKIGAKASVSAFISSVADDWRFSGHRSGAPLVLLLDGAKMELRAEFADSDVFDGGSCYEAFNVRLTRAQLASIAGARVVEGQLGVAEFVVPGPVLRRAKALVGQIPDGGSGPSKAVKPQ